MRHGIVRLLVTLYVVVILGSVALHLMAGSHCLHARAAPSISSWQPNPPSTPTPEPARESVVRFWLFYDSHCDSCLVLREEILPPIVARYEEGQVEIYEMDLEKGYYEEMLTLEAQYGLEYGEHALLGNAAIQSRLGELIDAYLAQGGVDLVEINRAALKREATAVQTPVGGGSPPPIHLAYFYQPGCRECDRVSLELNYLQGRYPQLVVREFDVRAEAAPCEWLGVRAGVPEARRLIAPAVFAGDGVLVDQELTAKALETLVSRYAATGAEPAWEGWQTAQAEIACSSCSWSWCLSCPAWVPRRNSWGSSSTAGRRWSSCSWPPCSSCWQAGWW